MGTDWKKSKLAARILCGWLGAISLLAALFCLASNGPDMLGGSAAGMVDLLAGQLSGSVLYQRQMADLFYNGALLAAGGADRTGAPLTAGQNDQLRAQAEQALATSDDALTTGEVLYAVVPGESMGGYVRTNSAFDLWDEGRVAVPLGYSVALAATSGQVWGNRALVAAYKKLADSQAVLPSADGLEAAVVVLAIRDSADLWRPGFLAEALWQVQLFRPRLTLYLASWAVAALCGLVCLFWHRRAKPARAWAASLTGRVWLEGKAMAWLAFVFCLGIWRRMYFPGPLWSVLPVLGWPLLWLTAVDLCRNGADVFRNSLLARLARLVAGAWRAQPWQRRVAGPALLCWLVPVGMVPALWLMFFACYWAAPSLAVFALVAGHLAALAILLTGLVLQLRFCRDAGRLADGLHRLRTGQDTGTPVGPGSPLAQAAADLNALQEGIDAAVAQQRRADRMKMELLTNVSHDLKTPLTSIITYAELLCDEPLEGAAADYAKVIQRKADRLKHMVQDVFDLSKAASGELPLAPEAIDLAKLIRQTLADMDEAIAASALTFRTSLPEEAWVTADGERMYRVFQNLFSNALKYSLPGSRVYVELAAREGRAVARVKNVANYEMEFDPGEITERFVRGDPSRTGEGSGLGLSIAKSFTEACGGELSVRVDADLFCVQVSLPLGEKPAEAPPPEEAAPADPGAGSGAAPAQARA